MFTKRLMLWIGVALLGVMAIFPSATFAQDETVDHDFENRLEHMFVRLQEVSQRGDERLAQARDVADRVAEKMAELSAQGIDVSNVETELAEFEAAIVEAEAFKAAGDAILDEHAGFDDDGNVTDPQVASETLRAVQDEFKNGRQTLREAARQLRHAIRDLRRDHRDGGGE